MAIVDSDLLSVVPTDAEFGDAISGKSGVVSMRFRMVWDGGDMSDAFDDGSITLDNSRLVGRTVSLSLRADRIPSGFDRLLNTVSFRCELYFRALGGWYSWAIGTFYLDLPNEMHTPLANEKWQVSGADPLIKYASKTVNESYTVMAGTLYTTAVNALVPEAVVTPSPLVTPADLIWPAEASHLQIAADLLAGINYWPLWYGSDGIYRSRPKIDPSLEPVAAVYSTLSEPRMVIPLWGKSYPVANQPNRATAKVQDAAREQLFAVANNLDYTSLASQPSRGLIRNVDINADHMPDSILADVAEQSLWDASAVCTVGALQTYVDPRRGAHETYQLWIEDVEVGSNWRVAGWTMPLVPGGAMGHTLHNAAAVALTVDA